MKVSALFAGIGGLELGLSQAGHETILFAENWDLASQVLSTHFPGVANKGDVVGLRSLPSSTDLLTAGFPCQDLSQAGRTVGIGGGRSGLVEHVFRLLDRKRVATVLLENVSFMLHLDGGRAMSRLVQEFETRGYRWAYRVVNSLAFLPQRRERVFFVASRVLDPSGVLLVDEADCSDVPTSLDSRAHGFYWTEGIRGLGWAVDAVPTLKNGSTVGIASPPAIMLPDGSIIKPSIEDAERLQGFPRGWTSPAQVLRKASWRWALVGNAVTVPVAEWIGRRLISPGEYAPDRDADFSGARWPKAARYDGRKRSAVQINALPTWAPRPPLVDFLEGPGELLSLRATAGFLDRIGRSKLRFPVGFRERVIGHLESMRARETGSSARGMAAE